MLIVAIVAGAALVMFVVELLAPGRPWKKVTGWWGRAALLNGVQVSAVFISGVTWDRWFGGWALLRLEDYLGFSGGAVAGYVVITFIYYWWHRWRHDVPLLWRVFCQSALNIDPPSASKIDPPEWAFWGRRWGLEKQTYRPLVHGPACLKHIGGAVYKGSISLAGPS